MQVPTGRRFALLLGLMACLPTAQAQWSKAASTNAVLSGGSGEEVQVKLAPASDGTTFVSFYDSDPAGSPAFGYDVVLQRLDPAGSELWPHGGITVADRGYSSTQDYGLDAGPNGDAWLAFRDDRFVGDQITAARVAADGTLVWGVNGVQLTSTTEFVASPRIAATDDGGCVVGWTQGSTTRLQKLDASGAPQWGGGVAIPVAVGETASLSSLGRSEGGAVILSWISQSGGFFGPRHLLAQKLSSTGAPQWPGASVPVFTSGSLQLGNFPPLVTDGAGGALFSWYGTGPLQCYAQHVRSDGSQSFGVAGTGVEVSTNATQIRVSPSLAYNQSTDEAFVFWVEQNSLQSLRGVSGQKLDGAGNRLWGPGGIEFVPLGGEDPSQVSTVISGGGAAVAFTAGPGFGQDEVRALRVDSAGVLQHAIVTIASTPSSKDDVAIAAGPFGDTFVAWHGDENGGGNDVLAQNLLPGGGLGPAAGGLSHTAGANLDSLAATVGALGGNLDLQLDLTTSGYPFGAVFGYLAPAVLPFGGDVILVDFTGLELLGLPVGVGPVASWSLPLPASPVLCGLPVYTQGVHADLAQPLRLSNAVDVYLGL
ncbi:hypothetical protein [Engelhardtia mirabilis]|uniref:hypothetical protein n=1 Tax=Engelhardtia mirabilis TaxID=2528011 RepID=UPI0011AAB64D